MQLTKGLWGKSSGPEGNVVKTYDKCQVNGKRRTAMQRRNPIA